MRTTRAHGGLALALCATVVGCATGTDDATPVASAAVVLSRTAAPIGSPIDVTYTFTVPAGLPPLPADQWVFVHMLDSSGELLWTDDHAPATPTQQWRAGTPVVYTRTTFVPRLPFTGTVRLEIGLFSRATGDRLPLSGHSRGMRAYEAATLEVASGSTDLALVFGDGWHDPESGEDRGRQWHWSRKEARLAFRNPRRAVVLYLEFDQPVSALPSSQQVEIRGPAGVLEQFTLAAGAARVSRMLLAPIQEGEGDQVEVIVSVSETFVPAAVPALKSSDTRELGVRLLNAYVEPE